MTAVRKQPASNPYCALDLISACGDVDKILIAAGPADFPVQHPFKFELAINLEAAEVIGQQLIGGLERASPKARTWPRPLLKNGGKRASTLPSSSPSLQITTSSNVNLLPTGLCGVASSAIHGASPSISSTD